jgi:cytochrome c2
VVGATARIPAGAIYLGAAIWLFVRLLESSERRRASLRRPASIALTLLLLPLLLLGCGKESGASQAFAGGDAKSGAALIGRFGCGACHVIPGIEGAEGLVGPPLNQMAQRVYVAGVLRNTPDNLITWLRHPQAVVPGNAMPDMGIDQKQASDIAAYLYTLN